MNIVSIIDLSAILGSLAALLLVFYRVDRSTWKPEIMLFTFIIILTISRDTGNFLEWAGLTSWFDPIEDYVEVLMAALWAFFLYTYIQELTEHRLLGLQELDEKILDGSPVAFVLHDLDMRVIRVSKAYNKVTGFKADNILHRTLKEFIPPGSAKDAIIARTTYVQEKGVAFGPEDIESTLSGRYLRETILPVFDVNRKVINTLTVLEDITEAKKARDALKESEERYKLLYDGIHDGVVVLELDKDSRPQKFLEANHTFCSMVGYSREELLGLPPQELLDSLRYEEEDHLKNALAMEKPVFTERLLVTRTGERLPCELNTHTFTMEGRHVILSVVRDITERKEAQDRIKTSLAEKETLLREIHHRVKNNLHVISGLLNLQSYYIDDEAVQAMYKESQNRIKTMALIHEELYQREDLDRINLDEYIRSLTNNLLVSYSIASNRIKLTLNLADTDISVDTAIPCGLIINELVSNALKHAFPGEMKGEIKISLKLFSSDQYELTVADNGIGLPGNIDINKTDSLGLQLVTVLSEQLGSDFHIESTNGTIYKLIFREYMEAGTEVH